MPMRCRRVCSVVAAFLLPLALVLAVHAYTSRQVGILSNILAKEGRVYFIQSDGSVTTLDLRTGDVVERDMEGRLIPGLEPHCRGRRLTSCKLSVVDEEWRQERPGIVVQVSSEDATWCGFLPGYYSGRQLVSVTEADGRIMVGTSLGHVECIEVATGRSIWLYHFATVRQTMSYTYPSAMPPGYLEAARMFGRMNRHADAYGGLIVLPSVLRPGQDSLDELLARATAPDPRVVRDPHPYNPYRWAYAYLALALGAAAVPVVLWIAHSVARGRGKLGGATAAAAPLAVVVLLCLSVLLLGWVSIIVRLVLYIELLAANAAAVAISFGRARGRQLWSKVALPVVSVILALVSIGLIGVLR